MRKKVLKVFIVIILLIFLLTMGLTFVMYLGDDSNQSDIETGIVETGSIDNESISTNTGSN